MNGSREKGEKKRRKFVKIYKPAWDIMTGKVWADASHLYMDMMLSLLLSTSLLHTSFQDQFHPLLSWPRFFTQFDDLNLHSCGIWDTDAVFH